MALNYNEWRARDQERRAAAVPFIEAAKSVRRTRPRSAAEADFLRRVGTPERLIGPVRLEQP